MKKLIVLMFPALIALAWLTLPGSTLLPQALAQSAEARVSLHIEGMTCASCSLAVRTALRRLDGVSDATVSVPDKRARVVYDPERITPERMVQTINDLGYRATVERESGQ